MDSNLKQKWIAALRSGKIRQGKGALARPDDNKHLRRCCLGVLCDLVEGVKRDKITDTEDRATYHFEGTTGTSYLPYALANELRLDRPTQRELAKMNDGDSLLDIKPKSFREIADWIDANL